MGDFESERSLDLRYARLSDLSIVTIGPNVEYIDLSYNEISVVDASKLPINFHLKHVICREAFVAGGMSVFLAALVAKCPLIEVLDLSHNVMHEQEVRSVASSIENLTAIHTLDVSNLRFSGSSSSSPFLQLIHLCNWKLLSGFKILRCADSGISKASFKALGNHLPGTIEELCFAGNRFADALTQLSGMPMLKSLDISRSDATSMPIAGIDRLECLVLDGVLLTDELLDSITLYLRRPSCTLRQLSLSSVSISSTAWSSFASLFSAGIACCPSITEVMFNDVFTRPMSYDADDVALVHAAMLSCLSDRLGMTRFECRNAGLDRPAAARLSAFVVRNLSTLVVLDISSNALSQLPLFEQETVLEVLKIDAVGCRDESLCAFLASLPRYAPALKELNCSSNGLGSVAARLLCSWASTGCFLHSLSLENNNFSSADIVCLVNAFGKQIRVLNVHNNPCFVVYDLQFAKDLTAALVQAMRQNVLFGSFCAFPIELLRSRACILPFHRLSSATLVSCILDCGRLLTPEFLSRVSDFRFTDCHFLDAAISGIFGSLLSSSGRQVMLDCVGSTFGRDVCQGLQGFVPEESNDFVRSSLSLFAERRSRQKKASSVSFRECHLFSLTFLANRRLFHLKSLSFCGSVKVSAQSKKEQCAFLCSVISDNADTLEHIDLSGMEHFVPDSGDELLSLISHCECLKSLCLHLSLNDSKSRTVFVSSILQCARHLHTLVITGLDNEILLDTQDVYLLASAVREHRVVRRLDGLMASDISSFRQWQPVELELQTNAAPTYVPLVNASMQMSSAVLSLRAIFQRAAYKDLRHFVQAAASDVLQIALPFLISTPYWKYSLAHPSESVFSSPNVDCFAAAGVAALLDWKKAVALFAMDSQRNDDVPTSSGLPLELLSRDFWFMSHEYLEHMQVLLQRHGLSYELSCVFPHDMGCFSPPDDALLILSRKCRPSLVEELVESDTVVAATVLESCLHAIVPRLHTTESVSFSADVRILRALLNRDPPLRKEWLPVLLSVVGLSFRNDHNCGLLHMASMHGNHDVFEFLLAEIRASIGADDMETKRSGGLAVLQRNDYGFSARDVMAPHDSCKNMHRSLVTEEERVWKEFAQTDELYQQEVCQRAVCVLTAPLSTSDALTRMQQEFFYFLADRWIVSSKVPHPSSGENEFYVLTVTPARAAALDGRMFMENDSSSHCSSVEVQYHVLRLMCEAFAHACPDLSSGAPPTVQTICTVLEASGMFVSVFCPHSRKEGIAMLRSSTMSSAAVVSLASYFHETERKTDPTVEIARMYFGEQIAVYFAFVSSMFSWMLLFSVVVIAGASITSQFLPRNADLLMAAAMAVLWGTLFVFMLQKKSSETAMRWRLIDYEELQEGLRPGFRAFRGEMCVNAISGLREPYFPTWLRVLRCVVSGIISLVLVAFSVSAIYAHVTFLPLCEGFVASAVNIAYSVFSLLLGTLYRSVAVRLTLWENYRLPSEHTNALVLKNFAFAVVNSYGLLVLALYQNFGATDLLRTALDAQLFSLMLIRVSSGPVVEFIVPFIVRGAKSLLLPAFRKKRQGSGGVETGSTLSSSLKDLARQESLPPFPMDLFDEYFSVVEQYGFVVLFGVLSPLCALLAVAFCLMQMKGDLFKYLHVYRRAPRVIASSSGVWIPILDWLNVAAAFTNSFIAAHAVCDVMQWPMDTIHVGCVTFACASFILLFRAAAASLVSTQSGWVRRELMKQRLSLRLTTKKKVL